MKTLLSSFIFIILIIGTHSCQFSKKQIATDKSKAMFLQDLDSLQKLVDTSLLPLATHSQSEDSLQKTFIEARQLYKKIEHFSEYFLPASSKLINGTPIAEIELTDNVVNEPSGFQVIEPLIYPFDTAKRTDLVREIKKLKRSLNAAKNFFEVMPLTDAHIFDAIRLQTFRIISLGITGFDTPLANSSLTECAISLQSIQRYLDLYDDDSADFINIKKQSQNAQIFLEKNANFDTFDRISFISNFINPLSSSILEFQKKQKIHSFKEVRLLSPDAKTLFAEGVFNPNFFTPNTDSYVNHERVRLGKKLFFDPVLSHGNVRSCASCHQPENGFTDGLVKPFTLNNKKLLPRNTPTLLNVALQGKQFYDLRTDNLENQSQDVIENKDEMHGSLKEISQKLSADKKYIELFKKAFPEQKGSIQERQIANALASFERSLISLNSRFDLYLRGDKSMLNASEMRGFNLFAGKAKCGICHFTPLFNGTVPPNFTNTESEVIGVPATPQNKSIDKDLGRYARYQFDIWKYSFKTPTLRNIEKTSPYMHNGVYKTLEEVVEFYNQGGGKGLGFDLPNQTLPETKLNLTESEQKDLVAFLKSLTDLKMGKINSL
ncbi:cytochrome c peroxidase [Arcicella sp. LKC2W]|uniref:cytochrome-c peroxidase n=1 Tax=Arcicella sp. LKC2W TaxID=2984198 RepID=UPI002B204479|nr:cytochrome c peroxidase [Arcicella sp. LKC2W]MEA5460898.1 cytochrome c peroxidase [Arcicella sp. LKC2W]